MYTEQFSLAMTIFIECTYAAVCTPSCLNGGRCAVPNVCNCTSDWRGETCSERKSICGGSDIGKANTVNMLT